jgi:hypothetical protein
MEGGEKGRALRRQKDLGHLGYYYVSIRTLQ